MNAKRFVIKREVKTGRSFPYLECESYWTGNCFAAKRFAKLILENELDEQFKEFDFWKVEEEKDEDGERLVNYRRVYYKIKVEELKDDEQSTTQE